MLATDSCEQARGRHVREVPVEKIVVRDVPVEKVIREEVLVEKVVLREVLVEEKPTWDPLREVLPRRVAAQICPKIPLKPSLLFTTGFSSHCLRIPGIIATQTLLPQLSNSSPTLECSCCYRPQASAFCLSPPLPGPSLLSPAADGLFLPLDLKLADLAPTR
jgi:hypothetical protein